MERLQNKMRLFGEKLPKKHGEWYRLKMYDDIYLVYDTWNGEIYQYKGCVPSDTNNLYRVVYVFSGYIKRVEDSMENFWIAHIKYKD